MTTPDNPAHRDLMDLDIEVADGPYSLGNYQQSESVGYLLKRCFGMLSTAIDQQLAPYDLTHHQFAILMILKQHDCSTAAELARLNNIDTGSVTRMLDRLQAKHIIRRQRCTDDRRVVKISLTERGTLIVEKMPIFAINVLNKHLNQFSNDELETFKQLLRKFIAHTNISNDEVSP